MAEDNASKQAQLKSISQAALLAGDIDAVNDLVAACKTNGFFYLDLRHESTIDVLRYADELAVVGKEVFSLSLPEKEEYSTEKYLPSRLLGYKRAGCSVGPFAEKRDGYESFSVHNHAVFGEDTMIVPKAIEDNIPLFKTWMGRVNDYTDCMLSILSTALQLPYDLKHVHRKEKPSSANMAMLNYLPWGSNDKMIGNMAHTDMGTLTVVFSKSDGLQAMLPGDDEWSFIPPRPGHAVVNVGDSLRFLSGNRLASSLHRVVPPPDSAGQDKFSVIYFLRPEFDAKFIDHTGTEINAIDWHNRKYQLFRDDSIDAKTHGSMLTGRQGYLGTTGA